jgi:molecular chaperone HscA
MQIIEIEEPNSRVLAKNEIIVGIDFGTTNSLIAVSQGGRVQMIMLENGTYLCPSVISVNGEEILVGGKANKNSINSIKRYLAKNSQEIRANQALRTDIEALILSEDTPKFLVGEELITLTELASAIFRHLIQNASKQLDAEVKKAVITVPAYFDDNARGQIILAAKLAGIEVLRVIAEPTAAAYAYGANKKKEGCYLIYDLGGGTFDISLLNMMQGVLQVVTTGGDSMIGGDDIDELFARYISDKYSVNYDYDLVLAAKKLKHSLSQATEVILQQGNQEILITREEFESAIEPLIDKTIRIAVETVREVENLDLDGIILVGGSTRIPLIRKKLEQKFDTEIFDNLDPDQIVAMGAAMHAENLSAGAGNLLIDAVSLSIGIELYGGLVEKIILRNTPIPFAVTKEFTTQSDNQTGIKMHIVQGEREMVQDCLSLAQFELTGIRPQKAGKARIEVTFAIDADGVLSVSALDKETSRVSNISLKPSYNVTEQTILDNLNAAYKNAHEDHNMRLLIETKHNAENLLKNIKFSLKQNPEVISAKQLKQIEDSIENLESILQGMDRDKIEEAVAELNEFAAEFICNYLDAQAMKHLKGKNINAINNN